MTESVLGPCCVLCGQTLFSVEPMTRYEGHVVHEGCLTSLENELYFAEKDRRG